MTNVIDLILGESNFTFAKIVREMDEGVKGKVAEAGVSKLYKSLMDKTYQDFGDIPKSEGDIKKYSGYKSLKETMEGIKDLATSSKVPLPKEYDIINTSISKMENYVRIFETGFKKRREVTILTYNNIVAAIVEGVGILLASSIEFVKHPYLDEIIVLKKVDNGKTIYVINQLEKFNQGMNTGEIVSALNYINGDKGNNFLGGLGTAVGITVGSIMAISALIMLLRELTFYFYYSRMKISDYINLQKEFMKYNIGALEIDNTMEPARKRRAIENQKKLVDNLQSLSDKIRVDDDMTTTQTLKELNKENKEFKVEKVEDKPMSSTNGDYDIL